MTIRFRSFAVLFALVAGAMAAHAQSSRVTEAAKAMVGSWEFSNADRDRRCTVSFRTETAGATGMKLDLDKGCATTFGFLKDVVAWTVAENDFLRFVDAKGRALLEFSEVEQGLFEAPKPGEGVLFLQNLAAVGAPPPSEADMAGRWTLMRGTRSLCTLTLGATTVADGLAVDVAPDCDTLVTRFSPNAWHMDRGELIVSGAMSQTWRFAAEGPNTWQRVPETRDPLKLVRR